MPSTLRHLKNPASDGSPVSRHRTGNPLTLAMMTTTRMTTTTGAGAPTGTGGATPTTTAGVATPGEMHETTSRKTKSTATGDDAQRAKSTHTRRLLKKKSSHAEHYPS